LAPGQDEALAPALVALALAVLVAQLAASCSQVARLTAGMVVVALVALVPLLLLIALWNLF